MLVMFLIVVCEILMLGGDDTYMLLMMLVMFLIVVCDASYDV